MNKDLLTSTFERIRSRLFSKARSVLSDDEDARDILQDAFFRLWSVRDKIQSESTATGLLVTTVRNLSIDRIRREKAHPRDSLDDNQNLQPDENSDEIERREEILAEVNSIIDRHLSERDRQILIHRDSDEWSFEDIAEQYGISEANARLIVTRARKKIRDIYIHRK